MKIKVQKIVGNLVDKRGTAIENSRQYLLLGTDILRKTIEPLFSVMVLLHDALDTYWSLRLGL